MTLGILVLGLTACGAAGEGERVAEGPQRYAADATVLDEEGKGAWLCVGIVLDSYPPQCGDVPLDGWDWDAVEGEESAAGSTWGDYRVIGTLDGGRFTVEEVRPPSPPPTESDYEPTPSPCPEPEGGWPVGDPEAADQARAHRAERYARGQPELVASWVTQLSEDPEAHALEGPLPVLYNAVFASDAARHEAAIRKVWAGPLCVVERDVPTARELKAVRKDAEALLEELGVRWTSSGLGGVERPVEIEVVADPDGEAQARLDERFGAGTVVLTELLEPVD